MRHDFDVLVIGGGHAGAEAAWAAAGLGARTALVTFDPNAIGRMSCNPAIGGIGKGQMVREIDALGGLMGRVADETAIQFRMLNRRKGPAMWSPRCQSDPRAYAAAVQRYLRERPNLAIVAGSVERILAEPRSGADAAGGEFATCPETRLTVRGLELADGQVLRAPVVIVTSGTFLGALMHTGERRTAGGRIGESAALGLSRSLAELGLTLGRLKTGTPPRLRRDTIEFERLEPQPGDDDPRPFSFLHDAVTQAQEPCWITFTTAEVHALIRANLHRAPMYSGQIASTGPRYCPSIEDKVVRFAEKERHQVFLEPEGRGSERIYCNGISTSLPRDVQQQVVAGITGLERAEIVQWGYAVEYDFVPPEQIDATLMTKRVAGLFLAGQINGTSGYEEAAGQGLVAGVNAARYAAGGAAVTLGRDEAYIGVMIDDLVTRGVIEPYRMFTSRAEHRLHLRCDNADTRLTPRGREWGLVDDARWRRFEARRNAVAELRSGLAVHAVGGVPAERLLQAGDADPGSILATAPVELRALAEDRSVWESALIDIRYRGYVDRQRREIERFRALETRPIPTDFNYNVVRHLRAEARDRWGAVRPRSVGQAARVSGIHPADVTMLMVALGRAPETSPT